MGQTLADQVVIQEIAKARALLTQQALFAAVSRLGILEAANAHLTTLARDEIRELLRSLDGEVLIEQILNETDRLRSVLAHGDRFEPEELVFALTLRVEIAAALLCAVVFAEDTVPSVDLSDCDEALEEISNSRPNRDNYRTAISLIDKNWRSRIPFSSRRLAIPSAVGFCDS